MNLTKEWIEDLAKTYGKHPKDVRDALWPGTPTKGLSYFTGSRSIGTGTLEKIADVIGCSTDELLRRTIPSGAQVVGNNNSIGNVNINNDPKSLHQIIAAQQRIIEHQDEEIHRMGDQLKTKDQQIDRLIKFAQNGENQ